MSDTLRAVSLLLSLALWSPVAGQLMRGEVSPERAGVLYAAALLLALGGCALLSQLVGAYTPADAPLQDGDADSGRDAATPGRRQEDAA